MTESADFFYTTCVLSGIIHLEMEVIRLILIDYRDRRPVYEQIVDRFQLLILKKVLKEDEQMPTVRKLAAEMAINPNTIQKAYRILEQQG